MSVLLATCRDLPDGEAGHEAIEEALAERGVPARWVAWDDPDVDWATAPVVAVRSTWDYHRRLSDFLGWTREVGDRLLNGPQVIAWNADKRYLTEIDCPVVPTRLVDTVEDVLAARAAWGDLVLKPRVGASGHGLTLLAREDAAAGPSVPSLAQPVVEAVRTEGEVSLFAFATGQGWDLGSTCVRKVPAAGEIRAHGERGATESAEPISEELREAAERALRAADAVHPGRIDYARIDLLRHQGRLVLGEIELIEPAFYLEVDPAPAARFADLVRRRGDR